MLGTKIHLPLLRARPTCEEPFEGSPSLHRNMLPIAVLVICAMLPYVNTLFNGFVYDDNAQVLENPYIQSFRYIPQIFTTTAWAFTERAPSNYYRPMMSLGYLFCYQLFGRSAYGFHLVNIVLHAAVVVMVFLVAMLLFRSRALSFWAAALFALHPIHTESVAWIGAVTDLELTFFYLLTFFFFLQTARPGGGTDRRMQIAMLISFGLAAISKEQALTLPLLATIYEHYFRQDCAETSWSQKLSRYDLLWIAAAAYMLVRIRLLGAFAPSSRFPDLSTPQVVLSAIALVGHYLWKLLFPARLCAFYVFHKSVSLWDWRVLLGGAAVSVCGALFVVLWKRARQAAFTQVWILLTLMPVLNAKWVGDNVFAERYLYLPSVGFCWLVAWAGLRLWYATGNQYPVLRRAFAAGIGLVAVLCSLRIVTRNPDWHDNLTFYQRSLAASPDAYILRVNLGAAYDRMGDAVHAEREWNEVLKSQPDNKVALADLGMLYSRQGLPALATQYLLQAIKADPSYAEAHTKLGFVYLDSGESDKAANQFKSSIRVAPLDISGYAGLAYVYSRAGNFRAAEEQLDRAEAINPSDPRIYFARGQVLAGTGRVVEARQQYEKALQLDPLNAEAQAGLRELESKTQP